MKNPTSNTILSLNYSFKALYNECSDINGQLYYDYSCIREKRVKIACLMSGYIIQFFSPVRQCFRDPFYSSRQSCGHILVQQLIREGYRALIDFQVDSQFAFLLV